MRCNQRFFGQEHFEPGTAGRAWCDRLGRLKPALHGGGFALRDRLPTLPDDVGGIAQVKYNGMLAVATWDAVRRRFVVWSHRGRCYYSLDDERRHPVTEWLDARAHVLHDIVLLGETHVVSPGSDGRCYMTPFNRSMSLIKNPRTAADVARMRLGVFDYRIRRGEAFTVDLATGVERFRALRQRWDFAAGVDSGPVHLVDAIEAPGSFAGQRRRLQDFWDVQVGERGFEGLILHGTDGRAAKIKYRDTLDVAILGFREIGGGVGCGACGSRFDLLGAIELVKAGCLAHDEWFDERRRLVRQVRRGDPCPVCGSQTEAAPKAVLGAKIALLRPDGCFVDVADGAQLSKMSRLLWELEPLYSADGYLWVRPTHVIEVSYQDVYADRVRPLYTFDGKRYHDAGEMTAVCLRPYGAEPRQDKSVNAADLRLEQLHHLVDRIHRIHEATT